MRALQKLMKCNNKFAYRGKESIYDIGFEG